MSESIDQNIDTLPGFNSTEKEKIFTRSTALKLVSALISIAFGITSIVEPAKGHKDYHVQDE